MKFGAVITAAGLSSRMGDFKPLMPLGNKTMIGRIIHTLREGGVENILVVTGRNAARIEQTLADDNIIFIRNKDYEHTDMFYSASLEATSSLEASSPKAGFLTVVLSKRRFFR
ncbi:hypothetical protein AGMMS4952_12980 [Spirochaetia bacterium]|nr:hypothetical protein AGMMS4952_12980 [Spirochaetia bacterium]